MPMPTVLLRFAIQAAAPPDWKCRRPEPPIPIRGSTGPEFIETPLREWLRDERIETPSIRPGSPWQNGGIDGFNSRLREECLDGEPLWTLTKA